MNDNSNDDGIRAGVRRRYGAVAAEGCCCGGGESGNSCCAADTLGRPEASTKLGYSDDELAAFP